MLTVPIPPMDAFRLGELFPELATKRFVQVRSERGADTGPCVGCGLPTTSVVTTSRRCDLGERAPGVGDVGLCSHRICEPCNARWPGCPHTWDEATMSLVSLGSTVHE